MKIYRANIPQGIGDNILCKTWADQVKNRYDQIHFTFHKPIVAKEKNNSPEYWKFLNDLGSLFYSEPPFVLNSGEYSLRDYGQVMADLGASPTKPELKHLLCRGIAPNFDGEYVILTTKIRDLSSGIIEPLLAEFWKVINHLSNKYKIVVMGEKIVEMCPDYLYHGSTKIYGIYDKIMQNIRNDRIIDLTVPALGISSPVLSKIQQDCLIMSEAQCVITLGVGGNLYLATSTSNTIGFRADNDPVASKIFNDQAYPNTFITKDWNAFISKIAENF